jgi:hypothetical protein
MERRTSRDEHGVRGEQSDNQDVFDDDYAADLSDGDDFVGVSDGFRPQPAQPLLSMQRDAPDTQSSPRRVPVPGAARPSEPQWTRNPSRSSIAKGHAPQLSLTIAHDGSNDPFADPPSSSTAAQRTPTAAQALMHRASVASTSSFATSGVRTYSLAGPSHPYAMYPQGTGVARNSSSATSSTQQQPPSRQSVTLERPQHPYGMYPQSPIDDPESDLPPVPRQAIPVGFPGLASAYHRQIGPDGEEQDIIGPDGHTEQLPPYSRYPEEGPTKQLLVANAAASVPVPPLQAPNASPDNNAPASDVASSDTAISQVERNGSAQESPQPDKDWNEKTWSERKKTRILCGKVPLWMVLVICGLVMLFAVILGATIGSILAKSKHHRNGNGNGNKHDNSPQ